MVILGVLELDFDIEDLLLDKIDDEVLLELLADFMSSTDDICGLVLVLTPGVKPLSPPVPPPPPPHALTNKIIVAARRAAILDDLALFMSTTCCMLRL